MKLFDEDEKYTEEAHYLDGEITKAMIGIAKKYVDLGYPIREVTHVMAMAALTVECELILERDHLAWKAKKAEEDIP